MTTELPLIWRTCGQMAAAQSDNVVTDQRPSNMAAQRLSVSSGTSGKPW